MAAKESNKERQNEELEVIKSIFGVDVEDLRPKNTSWKPLDIRILLTPLKGSCGDHMVYVKTKLHVICSFKYPKVVPKIYLEDTKGISDTLIEELLLQLQQQATALKGEVMIFDLAHTVQTFLHKHNKAPKGSFYDEMLQERQKREQEQKTIQLERQTLERKLLEEELEKRKEIYKNEAKRREPRRSISESNNRNNSTSLSDSCISEISLIPSLYYGSNYILSQNLCTEHRNSETFYFSKKSRQIKRGCCLKHSQKRGGCVTYSGIDLDTGQLLYITEWNIKYSQIESKCFGNCYWNSDSKCNGHKVDDFILNMDRFVTNLSSQQMNHKNLIQYELVHCMKRKEGLLIWLVQDFVFGTSLSNITSSLGWSLDGVRIVAKGILEALIFLHNKGISHSYLLDSTVFMDNSGVIRCTDFSFVPNLLELITGQKPNHGDLPALGSLIETLLPALPYEMRDFVEKCNSNRTLSASELLDHPFLRSSSLPTTITITDHKNDCIIKTEANRSNVGGVGAISKKDTLGIPSVMAQQFPSIAVSHCRLRTEFEVLTYLGKGAFGDVLKVRNILDNREYAIKRIPLPARSKQLYKKMTREVELLSRLNHENVVRYFNSWIESVTAAELDELDADGSSSQESFKPLSPCPPVESEEESSSNVWDYRNIADSDSDGIEFVNSNGEVAVYESDNQNISEDDDKRPVISPRNLIQVMYIQMEFCEKCTLRLAIDDNLYQNTERLWRYFREIAEGLSHIHQQGIIHRDLKPVNIFLDSHDQIKIGDFGLATTSFLALQSNEVPTTNNTIRDDGTGTGTGTGKVGTTLYVAPELTGNASKSTYNQKVDLYTLGIILFEMSCPPFETGMERIKTIAALRNPSIIIPENMLKNSKHEKTIKIIRWLLNHDPLQRPTAEELLASDLVPPAQLEASELQEMLRHVLENPQRKAYKHLVARCLQQESNEVLELTYHMGLVLMNPVLEFVKTKIINLFRKHGAIEVNTPLLNPLSKHTYYGNNAVRLMTHSGSVVVLPNDLRVLFARQVVTSGINMIRRYSIDRVYREKKVFNFHPRQNYECAFDIITPHSGNSNLIDAEMLSTAYEITTEIPKLKEKNISIRINHTNLLRAILIYCNVPKIEYHNLFLNFMDYYEGRLSKFHFHSAVTSILETSKSTATMLIDLMLTDFSLGGPRGCADSTPLRSIMRGKSEAATLAKNAIRELEITAQLAQSLGVTCSIHVCAGLPISYDHASTGGIVWQMITDPRLNRSTTKPIVLAYGERYDTMLLEFQKQAQNSSNSNVPSNRSGCISGVGFSFSLEKLATAIGTEINEDHRSIDVVVCVSGIRSPIKDVTYILRLLWSAGIRCGCVEANDFDEAQDYAKELGAVHVILLGENGELRVRSWEQHGKNQERHVTRTELVGYIQKLLTHETINSDWSGSGSGGGSGGSGSQSSSSSLSILQGTTSISSYASSIKNNFINHLPNIEVRFLTHDKMSANIRKRCENQVTQQMQSTLMQFGRKENFVVLVVDLTSSIINAIIGAINPREMSQKETEKEISYVIERFPKQKRYISEVLDDVFEEINVEKNKPIVALYSISDSCFRVII